MIDEEEFFILSRFLYFSSNFFSFYGLLKIILLPKKLPYFTDL
jgi:hypothetical protein